MPAAFCLRWFFLSEPLCGFLFIFFHGVQGHHFLNILYFTIKFVVVLKVCVASWDHSEPAKGEGGLLRSHPLQPVVPFPSQNGGLVGSKGCVERLLGRGSMRGAWVLLGEEAAAGNQAGLGTGSWDRSQLPPW